MCFICTRVDRGERVELVSTDFEAVFMMRGYDSQLNSYERRCSPDVYLYISGTESNHQRITNCPFCGKTFK